MAIGGKGENKVDFQYPQLSLTRYSDNKDASFNARKCSFSDGDLNSVLSTESCSKDPVKSSKDAINFRHVQKEKKANSYMKPDVNQSENNPDFDGLIEESDTSIFYLAGGKKSGLDREDAILQTVNNSDNQNNQHHLQEDGYGEVSGGLHESYEMSLDDLNNSDTDDSDLNDSTVAIDIAGVSTTDISDSTTNKCMAFRKRINPGLLSQVTFVYGPVLAYAAYTAYQYSLPEYNDKGEDGEVLPAYTLSRTAAAVIEGALVAGVIPLLETCADKLRNLKICNSYIFRNIYSRKEELHKVAGISLTAAGVAHTAGHIARAGLPVLTTQEGITGLLMLLGNGVIAGSYLSSKSDCFKKRLTYLQALKAHRYGALAMVGLLATHNSDRRLLPFVGYLTGGVLLDRLNTHVNHRFLTQIYSIQVLGSRQKQMCIQAELPARMVTPIPGQYFKLKLPELDTVSGFRTFTGGGIINGKIQFVISKSGIGTKKMFNAVLEDFNKETRSKIGNLTTLELIGPYSSSLENILYKKRVVMITTGAGCNLITAKLLHHYKSSLPITMMTIHCCRDPEESLPIIQALSIAQKYTGGSIHLFFSGSDISDENYKNGLDHIKELLGQIENIMIYESRVDNDAINSDNKACLKMSRKKAFTLARQITVTHQRERIKESIDQSLTRKIRVHIYNNSKISTESFPDALIDESKKYLIKNDRGCMPEIYCCGNKVSSNVATSLNSKFAQSKCEIFAEFL